MKKDTLFILSLMIFSIIYNAFYTNLYQQMKKMKMSYREQAKMGSMRYVMSSVCVFVRNIYMAGILLLIPTF